MQPIISIANLSKTYATGQQALRNVNLEIRRGEIFGLLGPNGAGKTTLIGVVCGIVKPSAGTVTVGGHDIVRDWRAARAMIGLVPQELTNNAFDSVWGTVRFSRGLFGRPPDAARLRKVLEDLSLWERRDSQVMTLSGGMKRRMLIAKALAHDPQILFLDEPTAGVDVELRQGMWQAVRRLRDAGATIILTTHYIEEAELMADRIGVINHGEIVVVDDKAALMQRLGRKQLTLELQAPLEALPAALAARGLALAAGGRELVYTYDAQAEASGIADLLRRAGGRRHRLSRPAHHAELARGHLRRPGAGAAMNLHAIRAIYLYEMARTGRTLWQSVVAPVVTDLALLHRLRRGDRHAHRRDRGRGLRRLHRAGPGDADAADAERVERLVRHLHAALHRDHLRDAVGAGVGAARSSSATSARRRPSRSILGVIILATASLFVPLRIAHPVWMIAFLLLTAVTFSLLGFIIGIWADGFEQLQFVPLLVITPLTFLGGTFYSIDVLPPVWQTVTLFNPVVYLVERLSLELLRDRRRPRRREPRHDGGLPRRLPGRGVVDLQNGLPPEGLAWA